MAFASWAFRPGPSRHRVRRGCVWAQVGWPWTWEGLGAGHRSLPVLTLRDSHLTLTAGAFSRLDPTGRFKKLLTERLPAKRLGEPVELANLATYLLSPYASWVNGQLFTFDGGESAALAGEFNALDIVTQPQWDMMESTIRSSNKAGGGGGGAGA